MELMLDREDLLDEHQNDVSCSTTRFEHFKPDVQQAIQVVGRAMFRDFGGATYNAIYPPRKDET